MPRAAVTPEPAGACLRSLTVSGFRGIGQPATLTVHPGPGLTVVVGRNGSGKSSFADAMEVLLTGSLWRWEELRTVIWRQGWRSMHQNEEAEIRADFLVAGAAGSSISRAAQRVEPRGRGPGPEQGFPSSWVSPHELSPPQREP